MTVEVSLASTIARVQELEAAFVPPVQANPNAGQGSGASFAAQLQGAVGAGGTAAVGGVAPPGAGVAGRIVAAAEGEVGQAEQPPGSNDSPAIARYRSATRGAIRGAPWCAYFVSWAAKQAGAPLGDHGEGFGSVDALYAWAKRVGRAVPAQGHTPRAGDLIVWNEHVGIVERVLPDGRIQTIEGNSSNRVSRNVHPAGDAIGYVRMS